MNSVTLVTTYKNEAGTTTVKSETVEGDLTLNLERGAIDPATVNAEFNIAIDVSAILAIGIGCTKTKGESADKSSTLVVKTNSTSTPDDTFTVNPSNGLVWSAGDPTACPLTTDVTKLYISNPGTAKSDLTVRILLDSSPGLGG